MPLVENPYLYIVLAGVLRLHTPSGIMDYMAGQYSISKIDTPPLMGTVLDFSEQHDFLALAVEFTVNDVITTVLILDNDAAAEGASLMAIQTNDPRITLVAGGYPLFVNGKIVGGIGVGGGTEEEKLSEKNNSNI